MPSSQRGWSSQLELQVHVYMYTIHVAIRLARKFEALVCLAGCLTIATVYAVHLAVSPVCACASQLKSI